MTKHIFLIFILLVSCADKKQSKKKEIKNEVLVIDSHVHIMSPQLISDFKALGIPFSKPDFYYSNIDSIIKNNSSDFINLIGMGYVYESQEFYQGEDRFQKLKKENDYVLNTSQKYPNKLKPYFTIDPLKEYAFDEINRCIQINPNAGLKLHFSTSQVYLTEPEHLNKVKTIFDVAAKNKLPILLHFDNWHPKFGTPDVEILIHNVLAEVDSLQLTIAHFGTSGGFNQKTKNVINAFSKLKADAKIPSQHTIYFDISGVALDKDSDGVDKLSKSEFIELKEYCLKLGLENIVFGTDYPLYTSEEYHHILKEKLELNDTEIEEIINKKWK